MGRLKPLGAPSLWTGGQPKRVAHKPTGSVATEEAVN
jgi:hypothetical protein